MKPPIAAVSSDPTLPLSLKTAFGIRKWVCRSGSPGVLTLGEILIAPSFVQLLAAPSPQGH